MSPSATYQPDEGEGGTAIGLAEPLPSVCRILELLKAGADTRLRMLPLATAVYGDDLRPRVAQLYQPTLGFQLGDIITKVNGGREIKSLPDLLNDLRGTTEEVSVTVDRKGAIVNVVSPVRILADPLKVRSINLSGLVISEPWRIDDLEVNPKRYALPFDTRVFPVSLLTVWHNIGKHSSRRTRLSAEQEAQAQQDSRQPIAKNRK